jgi:lysozyme
MGSPFRQLACPALLALAASVGAACSSPEAPERVGTTSAADTLTCDAGPFVEGVDIYDGTGTVDWNAARTDGIAFAIMKATQGDYNTQQSFTTQWTGTKAAGVVRGAYHFFDTTIDGIAQANHFLTVMGQLVPGDLPPMLDIECPDGDPNCMYQGGSGDETASVIHQRMWDWIHTVEQATGRKPLIYTFSSYFSSNGVDTTGLDAYPLFIAYPTTQNCFNVPTPWAKAVVWQWSWTGSVSGISSQVDRDRFLGTMSDLQTFAAGFDAPAQANGNEAMSVVNWPDGHIELFATMKGGVGAHLTTQGTSDTWSTATFMGAATCGVASVIWPGAGGADAFDPTASGATQLASDVGSGWSAFQDFGGMALSHLSALAFADGHVEVFALGGDGAVWDNRWDLARKAWAGWVSLGGAMTTGVGPILWDDGHAEIFATDSSGVAWHNWTASAPPAWQGWAAMAGGKLATRPVPARWADGHVEVFARGTDGLLYTSASATQWTPFTAVNPGTQVQGEPSVLVYPGSGPEVFARSMTGQVMHLWWQASAWSPWATDFNESVASDVLGWMRPDGNAEVFAVDSQGQLVRSLHSGATWTPFAAIGTGFDDCQAQSAPLPPEPDGGGFDGPAGNEASTPPGAQPPAPSRPASGCGCRIERNASPAGIIAVLPFLLAFVRRRRGRP